MFDDYESEPVSFKSTWKKQKKHKNQRSQTSETITYEVGLQTKLPKDAEVQTDTLLQLMKANSMNHIGHLDVKKLSSFLKSVEPKMTKQIKINNAMASKYANLLQSRRKESSYLLTEEFTFYEKLAISEENDEDIQKKLEVTSVSWSKTGASVAISYGSNENMSWSEHRSYICVWNLDRPKMKLDECDHRMEVESSVQVVEFHPTINGLIAGGLFSGVIVVYDVSSDEGYHSNQSHNDPVTCVRWMENNSNSKSLRLLSSSTDGKLVVWKFRKGSTKTSLSFEKEHVILGSNIPKSFGSKGRGSLGITCLCPSYNLHNSGMRLVQVGSGLVVGMENGMVLKCSVEVNESNPVTFAYKPHKGPVYSIDWSPFSRNIFLTSSTDKTCRIYHSLESVPLRCVQLEDFAPKLNAQLLTARWSHTRPCLFLIGCHDHVFCYDVIEEKAHFCAKIESGVNETRSINDLQLNSLRRDSVVTALSSGENILWRMGEGLVEGKFSLQYEMNHLKKVENQQNVWED